MAEVAAWKHSQALVNKGGAEFADADTLSAVSFDWTGEFIATGDRGGRVTLYRKESDVSSQYRHYTTFQSHDPEFDYLKSLEIEEKINKVVFLRSSGSSRQLLLSTNDKTVKLWRVHEREVKRVAGLNLGGRRNGFARGVRHLKLPKLSVTDTMPMAMSRRVYANAHAYHINSIALSSDGETFISADDLRINLWHFDVSDISYTIVDIKPTNMEDLAEVITAAEFHPSRCNMFVYSSSRGSIRLCDLRDSALCDGHSKMFLEEEDPAARSFYSEIIASVSDVKFTPDGDYIISRDYMTVKVWDLRREDMPVRTIPVHEHLEPKLCDLYDTDAIFDKFEVALSGDGQHILTGSYGNRFSVYDRDSGAESTLVASEGRGRGAFGRGISKLGWRKRASSDDSLDYDRKLLNAAWHPDLPLIALTGMNNLYIYRRQ
eukprot:PLAT4179.1.p1 GENE.PLAT4179.1~~PLAT4179.1.p1  ORF type:complete len:432 (+),score=156.03 PLAT4179.1:284-1579(+)